MKLLLLASAPATQSALARFWSAAGLPLRIGLPIVSGFVSLIGIILFLRWLSRKLGPRLWRWLLIYFAAQNLVSFVSLAIWTSRLPEEKGTAFLLSNQIVKIGTVLSGMGLTICL